MYPAWRYHATLPACIVQGPDEDDALGPDWANNPAGPFPGDKPVKVAKAPAEAPVFAPGENEAADALAGYVPPVDPNAEDAPPVTKVKRRRKSAKAKRIAATKAEKAARKAAAAEE
jgi:hypothetical protein